jgi:hypothetical protein
VDLLERARARFADEPEVRGSEPVVLAEITLHNLATVEDHVGPADFLARADVLHALGIDVLVSRFRPFYQLTDYLARYSNRMIGLALGVPTLREVLDEQYYEKVDVGALASVGRLFQRSVKMYVYPTRDRVSGGILTMRNAMPPPPFHHLRDFLLETGRVEALSGYDEKLLSIRTPDVLARLQAGDPSWEAMVPPTVAECIKTSKLFGYRG